MRTPLAETIRWAYQNAGLKQADVAAYVGVGQGAVSDWALGRYAPSLDTIAEIEKCCGLQPGTILLRAGYVSVEASLDHLNQVFRARQIVPDLRRADVRQIWHSDLPEDSRRQLVAELQGGDDAAQLAG